MLRTAISLSLLALAATLALGRAVHADEAPADAPAPAAAQPAPGPLRRAASPTYYAARPSVAVRSGPAAAFPVVSTITTSKPLQALGMVFEGDPDAFRSVPEVQAVLRTWIKVRLPAGGSGFIGLVDLLTPQQIGARGGAAKKVGLLESAVAAAGRTKGAEIPSGLYAHGGSCDASDVAPASFLQGKVLIWQEGPKLHFVNVLQPDDPTLYDAQNDAQVRELQGFGYVPMRTFRSSKDAVLMGFKDRLLWFTTDGNRYDSYEACNADGLGTVVSMLKAYASQRPPENR